MPAGAYNASGESSLSSGGGFSAAQGWAGVSGVFGAIGKYQSGRVAKMVGRMRKKEYEAAAKRSVASAQRRMLDYQKQAELIASRAVAVAAAGGGNVDDITVQKIIGDIQGEGAYRAAVALYEGEEQARQLRYQGKMAEWEGDQAYDAAKIGAIADLVETGAKAYAYG